MKFAGKYTSKCNVMMATLIRQLATTGAHTVFQKQVNMNDMASVMRKGTFGYYAKCVDPDQPLCL